MARSWGEWLGHAFAVAPSSTQEMSEAERASVDRVCRAIRERGMAEPALLFLVSMEPLAPVSAQLLRFLEPVAQAVAPPADLKHWQRFLERRGAVLYLSERLDASSPAAASPSPPSAKESA